MPENPHPSSPQSWIQDFRPEIQGSHDSPQVNMPLDKWLFEHTGKMMALDGQTERPIQRWQAGGSGGPQWACIPHCQRDLPAGKLFSYDPPLDPLKLLQAVISGLGPPGRTQEIPFRQEFDGLSHKPKGIFGL
ncbi:MAG: hypothetical protein GY847_32130 [Proteobacteria bacterium]|nr:hypothetical protein [Pseudomonadota bacterium]